MKNISIRKAIKFTRDQLEKKLGKWFSLNIGIEAIIVALVLLLASLVGMFFHITMLFPEKGHAWGAFAMLATWILIALMFVYVFLQISSFVGLLASNALDAAFDRPLRRFKGRPSGGGAFAILIIGAIGFVLGIVLLIIPGIIFIVRCRFALYAYIEDRCSVMQAFKKSWNLTRGNFGKMFLSFIISSIFNIMPISLLLLIAPINIIFDAYIYYQLVQESLKKENQASLTE